MRVLVFGGSFDPPHVGHTALLKAAIKAIKPDEVLIVPAFQAPLKGTPSASPADRAALAKAAFGKRGTIDRSEMRAKRKVYTVDTLTRLKKKRPEAELHFVVGSDSAAAFARWKDPAKLKKLATWWTGRRPGAPKPPPFFKLVPGQMPDASSTEARRRLALGEDAGALLPPEVEDLIRRKGLYGVKTLARLSRSLKEARFEHTLCVARLADELAARHGLDRERARLAGLLHDCGRALRASEMPAYARRRGLKVPGLRGILANNPTLLHAFIGEDKARREHGVVDPEVLAAIRSHTLGRPGMGPLERVLYVADFSSEDRGYREAKTVRALARRDLERAFRETVAYKRFFVRKDGAWAHPLTDLLWNSLKKASR
jgi:nicotinate-nucleotide adenylyltransferase